MAQKLTTCTFCGAGCGIYLETHDNRVIGAYPSLSHPTNAGRLCLRGWHVHEVASSPDRLKRPLLRQNGELHEVTWDEAIDFVAARLLEIRRRHGPDAIAFLSSPRCSNEESYLLQKLARTIIGTNNVGHGAGVYCNNSINVLLDMLGIAASTNSINDLANSEVIMVDGVDLKSQLPTIAGWVVRAKLKGARLIVVDMRRHRVAENADLFLQIKPGTEVALYGGMAKVIVDRGLANLPFIKAHCNEYEGFLECALSGDLQKSARACDVPAESIEAAAISFAKAGSAALLYSTGVESRGKASIQAMVNLLLLTGQIGKKGAGLFPLTEQNNLQGVCDMGMLPDRLPGYLPVTDSAARGAFTKAWKAPIPAAPGLGADEVLNHRGHGRVKAVWFDRYDPMGAAMFGDSRRLGECELVVTQHLFKTGLTQLAHVVLPTTAFGEERVSFTSTERRIQLAEKVIDPAAGPMPAWEQLVRLAQAMGADWKYTSSEQIMDEIASVIPFYGGVSYESLAREYGRQWPCTKELPLGTPRLFENGPDGKKFNFAPLRHGPPVSAASSEYPLTLVFGHSLYYWHQNALIDHSETLKREHRLLLMDYPDGFVEINTDDAKRLHIRDGEKIRLRAATGSAISTARVTAEVRSGAIFVPYFVQQLRSQLIRENVNGNSLIPVRVERNPA
ncbi:MAG: molybdopterin-dependent oxidoreductase [Tepidisphaeraceae bacterium]|jgi:formate dehydrogenase major subunit/formate dehydrogenase alpha subunit